MNIRPDDQNALDLATATPGSVVVETSLTVTRPDLVAYANASGDQNPIHQDEAFARSVGLPDVIAHGMLTMGLVASQVEAVADGRRVLSYGARFAAPVVVSSDEVSAPSVDVVLTLLSRDDAAGTVTLDAAVSVAGTKVLSRTRAVIQL